MKSRLFTGPKNKSYFLLGPRATGKSTWLRANYPHSPYIDLLEDEVFNRLLSHPQDLSQLFSAKINSPIIIDEIQKIPALLDEVHRLIENHKYHFVLTGSSARKLRKQGVNLLAGRALHYSFFPLTAAELGNDFDLTFALKNGTLPALLVEDNPKKYLESYVRLYIKEEVKQEGLARNLQGFSRFLEAASFSHSSPLVISNVAKDCAIERKVVEDYFAILEDLMIGYFLPVFTKRSKREMLLKKKFYFFDAGVFQT